MHDVIVIGGGPAGLTAARVLAEAGHDTVVVEEHADIGRPVHCTGVLGLDAFDELDLPRHTILTTATRARFTAPGGDSVTIDGDICAAIIDRGAFDDVLATRARLRGAAIVTGSRVRTVEVGARHVTVHVDGGAPRTARACVVAAGANYRFNRQLGLGVPRAFVQSAQVQVPFGTLDHIDVRFGREVAPGGFAWLVPFRRDGQSFARVGVMCQSRARQRFDALLAGLGPQIGPDPRPVTRFRMLPLGPVSKTYTRRVLAVGDAAGLVKPTTGGGIYYGILSGQYAGDTLAQALGRDVLEESALRQYEARWRERLGPEIRAGLAFRAIASRIGDSAISALIELARVDGLTPLLKQTANFNWHRTAALALLRNANFRRIVLSSLWS